MAGRGSARVRSRFNEAPALSLGGRPIAARPQDLRAGASTKPPRFRLGEVSRPIPEQLRRPCFNEAPRFRLGEEVVESMVLTKDVQL